ncbi:MAG TPA: class I SAM-dependent methyltransferase [Acidobacteriota bacterium]|nr:class I SAM-dependent methyltransferase [Acidobacteriota bacterium]
MIKKLLAKYPKNLSTFIKLRFLICPFDEIATLIPNKGRLLDIGTGYGLFPNYLKDIKPQLNITAIDYDKKRIEVAKTTTKNIQFKACDATQVKREKYDIILLIDLLHHIDYQKQETLIKLCKSMLNKGGILLIKDLDTRNPFKYLWNYAHDIVVARQFPLFYRTERSMAQLLKDNQFKVTIKRVGTIWQPYNHKAYICSTR